MDELKISKYWSEKGKTLADRKHGKVWDIDGNRCDECCNGDRCDTPGHYNRSECPYCLGTGVNLGPDGYIRIKEMAIEEIQSLEEKRKEIYKSHTTLEVIQNFSYRLHEIEVRIQTLKSVLAFMKELNLI